MAKDDRLSPILEKIAIRNQLSIFLSFHFRAEELAKIGDTEHQQIEELEQQSRQS